MKTSCILLFLFLGLQINAQRIEIWAEQYPFYNVLEWKGMGTILMNRDPSGNMKKVNLTLAGNSPTHIWQQSFNPNGKDFYYISSENARYVYFLDNLNLEAGKVSFHQLNSAGNVKSTSVSLASAIKKLGYDPLELELIDIVTTDKALVHIFRYHNEKDKKYVEIATFITHHNLLEYATILGEIPDDNIKSGNFGMWKYIGFTEDQIAFATRDLVNKKSGWTVKTYTSKGVLSEARFIEAPSEKFDFLDFSGLGTHGSIYLGDKTKHNNEKGSILFHKNQFYLTGTVTEGTNKTAKLFQLTEGKWNLLNSHTYIDQSKKVSTFGTYVLNEGVACKIGSVVVFLPYSSSSKPVQSNFKANFNTNPSRMIIEDKKEQFAVYLADGVLYFDTNQLNKPGNVIFEFVKK